jgi:TolA-binding protein
LKLGQTYARLGDQEKARMMFDRVLDQYPDSSEAELARRALDAMTSRDESTSLSPE